MFVRRCIIFLILSTTLVHSQPQSGSANEIKEVITSSNNISTILFNYGSIGAPNRFANIADLAWEGLGYMFEFGPMISAKVSENNQQMEITSDSFIRNFQGDYDPTGTLKWGFLPEPGYSNPAGDEIANSKNPESWPSNWTSWPGKFGDGVLVAENEIYYKMNDFTNAEFPYYPFPSDTTKKGLGVSVTVRIYQAKYGLADALIVKYFIKNESPKNLDEVYFGFMGDPHIGGASDYGDDRVGIIKNSDIPNNDYVDAVNTIYNYDDDMKGAGGRAAYYMSLSMLETPDQKGLTSFHPAVYTNSLPNVPMNDPLMWEWFTGGIDYNNDLMNDPGDNVIHFGTGPFTLNSLETKEVSLAIFFSYDLNDVINDAVFIKNHFNWMTMKNSKGDEGGNENYKISLTSPINTEYNSNINIEWDYQGNDQNAKAMIEYSPDLGKSWKVITPSVNATDESYLWDISNVNDGMNYLVRIIAYCNPKSTNYYYKINDERFGINKQSENAKPELTLLSEFENQTFTTSQVKINWISEDIDNQELTVELEYYNPIYNSWIQIDNFQVQYGTNEYDWDISDLANGNGYKLRVTVDDGNSTTELETKKFNLDYFRGYFVNNIVNHTEGKAEAELLVNIVNPNEITSDTYEVTFSVTNENEKRFKVMDLTTETELVTDYPITDNFSTFTFHGMKLKIKDEKSRIDSSKSGFTRSALNSYLDFATNSQLPGVATGCSDDWKIIFNDLDTLADGSYLYPGDTVQNTQFNEIIVPFRILNIDYNKKAEYLIHEINPLTRGNGKWDFGETIILRPQNPAGAEVAYGINISKPIDQIIGLGDTLKVITFNGIKEDDVYLIEPNNNYVLGVEEDIPNNYALKQNYPNPFNPSTTIVYSIPKDQLVTLKIYDVLGREVKTLVDSYKSAGNHKVNFNAANLSSGIYLYRIKAGNFIKTNKMILIK